MIYLDNAATTRPDGSAFARAASFANECFYNPSARYGGGFSAAAALNEARGSLLSRIADAAKYELVFTSGGTESDNFAIFSAARRGNAVTTAGEHAAVERPFSELKNRGVEVRIAPVNRDGSADAAALLSLVDEKTALVSVMHVNNETGAVNDISAIARAVKAKNPRCVVHSDGVQAFGKLPFRMTNEIDLYSLSAHKIGGIKGVGALVKRRTLALSPLLCGGGQEGTLRSGTENLLGALDFAYAAEGVFASLSSRFERVRALQARLWGELDANLFTRISPENGSPYILTVAAAGTRGEVIQRMLWEMGVAVGTGSACSSKKPYSRVLEACGYGKELLGGVLRFSFSAKNTEEEIVEAARLANEAVREFQQKV